MTTKAERARVRAALHDNRMFYVGDILAAITEEMPQADETQWLRRTRREIDARLDHLSRFARSETGSAIDCNRCGRLFYGGPRALYCSSGCRQAAYRDRPRG